MANILFVSIQGHVPGVLPYARKSEEANLPMPGAMHYNGICRLCFVRTVTLLRLGKTTIFCIDNVRQLSVGILPWTRLSLLRRHGRFRNRRWGRVPFPQVLRRDCTCSSQSLRVYECPARLWMRFSYGLIIYAENESGKSMLDYDFVMKPIWNYYTRCYNNYSRYDKSYCGRLTHTGF